MKLASVLLLALVTALPAFAQQATREDFKELCQVMTGRWVGDVTWIADWPGMGKRGDKVTAYLEIQSTQDNQVLLVRFYGGTGSGVETIVYDAGAKQIRASGGDSGGRTWVAFFSKNGGAWRITASGSLVDGTKFEGVHTLTISDGRNKLTYSGPGAKIGGKQSDPLNDVWRRASK